MWRRIADWYQRWEEEQIAVLERPELAVRAGSGFRRFYYARLVQRSPLERQQLRDFSLALQGRRGWLWTAALLTGFSACGAGLHFRFPELGWTVALLGANLAGFFLAIVVLGAWFNYRKFVQIKAKMLLAVLGYAGLCGLGMVGMSFWGHGQPFAHAMERASHFAGGVIAGSLVIVLPVLAISLLRNRHYESMHAQLQRDAEQARLARELSETQLRLLRAQIEPHFLFNTLGAVQQLAQHGAPRAAELTGNLIDFLRSSMRDMRSEQVALEAEFGLVESYLKVMQVRLGERLRFSLQLPAALGQVRVPSMILLTLVENAIKHGIEPALRGGDVMVSAEALDGAVLVRVQDGGVGMGTLPEPDGGGGSGLDNVRHRLRLAYGEQASLRLHDGAPGLIADITIPQAA